MYTIYANGYRINKTENMNDAINYAENYANNHHNDWTEIVNDKRETIYKRCDDAGMNYKNY